MVNVSHFFSFLMENKTFTFHIHLPIGVERVGQPVVLGDREELGSWENPIVKLHRPFRENPTYWKSKPVKISLTKFEKDVIKYKFAIFTTKYVTKNEIVFEGNEDEDSRILDIERDNQFAVWKNNKNFVLSLDKIQDYAFVDCIFNSIKTNNLKDKVMDYQ